MSPALNNDREGPAPNAMSQGILRRFLKTSASLGNGISKNQRITALGEFSAMQDGKLARNGLGKRVSVSSIIASHFRLDP
jgi:hypothetical protein